MITKVGSRNIIPDEQAISPDQVLDNIQQTGYLIHLLQRLDERERTVIQLRYGLDGNPPKTLDEVSKQIGRTRERVRQIQKKAINKLRAYFIDERNRNTGVNSENENISVW